MNRQMEEIGDQLAVYRELAAKIEDISSSLRNAWKSEACVRITARTAEIIEDMDEVYGDLKAWTKADGHIY